MLNRTVVARALRKTGRDGIESESCVKGRNEADIDVEPRRILDLGLLKTVEPLALFLRDKINLAHAVAELRALQCPFKTRQAPARARPIGENLAPYAAREYAPDDERFAVPYAHFVEPVARRLIVGRDNYECGASFISYIYFAYFCLLCNKEYKYDKYI